jgi:hypothetical protein
MHRLVCITRQMMRQKGIRKKNVEHSLLNVKEGDVIKALDDLPLHLLNCCHTPCHMEMELHCAPILLDEVKFTMIFWIKVTQMAMQLN